MSHTIVHESMIEIHSSGSRTEWLKNIWHSYNCIQTCSEIYLDRAGHEEVANRAARVGRARGEVDRVLANKASAQHLLQAEIFENLQLKADFLQSQMGKGIMLLSLSMIKYRC